MNKSIYLTFLFLFLFFVQVFVLNNILLFGYVNPYLYIAFVFFYPLQKERYLFLFLSFALGLLIDWFSDTGGIYAFSILSIAYVRLFFVKTIFQKTEVDYPLFKLQTEPFGKVFNYVSILTILHHFILFSLANFSFRNFTGVIINTLFSSVFTLVVFFLVAFIFSRRQ